jgi:hypothetical protein
MPIHPRFNFDQPIDTVADACRFVDDCYDFISRWTYDFSAPASRYRPYGITLAQEAKLEALNRRAIEVVGEALLIGWLMTRQAEDCD